MGTGLEGGGGGGGGGARGSDVNGVSCMGGGQVRGDGGGKDRGGIDCGGQPGDNHCQEGYQRDKAGPRPGEGYKHVLLLSFFHTNTNTNSLQYQCITVTGGTTPPQVVGRTLYPTEQVLRAGAACLCSELAGDVFADVPHIQLVVDLTDENQVT